VPIAAGLIHLGASPGAALAFLIAGPATNAATITTVWKLLGGRTTILYLLTIAISAIGSGLMLDWLMPAMQHIGMSSMAGHVHEHGGGDWISAASAILLLAVLVLSYAKKPRPEAFVESTEMPPADPSKSPQQLELTISGMTCQHCVAAITRALNDCPGVKSVHVDLATGRAVVAGENFDPGQCVAAVVAVGYSAQVV
jgi:copper chaperone CopZ